jgi:hypothetical protein
LARSLLARSHWLVPFGGGVVGGDGGEIDGADDGGGANDVGGCGGVMWVVGCYVGGWWLAAAAPWRAPNEMKTGHEPIFTGAKLYLLGSCKYC